MDTSVRVFVTSAVMAALCLDDRASCAAHKVTFVSRTKRGSWFLADDVLSLLDTLDHRSGGPGGGFDAESGGEARACRACAAKIRSRWPFTTEGEAT